MINEINYNELIIDKENDYVSYNDEYHKYWTKDTNQNCISVTTLIHQFENFDEDFWSSYKAIEALLSTEDFKNIKSILLDKKIFSLDMLESVHISIEDFQEKKKEILADWQEKRETSCIRGTAIHKEHELEHLAGKTKELQHLGLGGTFKSITSNKLEPGQFVYPELLLHRISDDGKLRVAGQADLVIIDGYDVYILDYKTSKEIKTKAYFDRKTRKHTTMKYPLNNIQDTNFWHYSLQLSTYAWMIQKINPKFNIKSLILLHEDHDGNKFDYECEYLKVEVEKMLGFYKSKLEHDEFKRSRQKITF